MFFFKNNKNHKDILFYLFLFFLITVFVALYLFDLLDYFRFENLKAQQNSLENFYSNNPLLTIGGFFCIYVFIASFSLPLTALLTLSSGFLFGLTLGTLLSSFASVIGATVSFLMSRFFLKSFVERKFKSSLKKVSNSFEKEGIYYLFALRLIPLIPFFLVNILMSLTTIKTKVFFLASQIGMLPSTIAYAYAGTRISQIQTPGDIFSFKVLSAFAILGLLPLATKKLMDKLSEQKRLKKIFTRFK